MGLDVGRQRRIQFERTFIISVSHHYYKHLPETRVVAYDDRHITDSLFEGFTNRPIPVAVKTVMAAELRTESEES